MEKTPPSDATTPTAEERLARVRHDLRTPLNQIIGYTEMLQEVAAEELQPDLAKVHTAAMNLVAGVDKAVEAFRSLAGDAAPSAEPRETRAEEPNDARSPAPSNVFLRDNDGDETGTAARTETSLLVVDDNEMNRSMLSRRLERRGFDVVTIDSGEGALALLRERSFDLVLLDVMMPGMSGIEVLEAVRKTHPMSELPIIMATARDGSADVVHALALGANDYVTKPIDLPVLLARAATQLALKDANLKVRKLAEQLETRNAFIRQAFGRYVTDEVVEDLLTKPDGLALGGESRTVSIMMSDLRGFTPLSERLTPKQVITLLNQYLGAMTEVIISYGGTIDEFIGDAILVVFGAPVAHVDHAARAVACGLAMQLAMTKVNAQFRAEGLPEVQMGIGINTGEVVVGNIGSQRRAKYGVVGRAVNLTQRIESLTVGGQVLVSETTFADVPMLKVESKREVMPKGAHKPITIYEIGAIGGLHAIVKPSHHVDLVPLREALPVTFAVVEGYTVPTLSNEGSITALSADEAMVTTTMAVDPTSTVSLRFVGQPGEAYGKVLRAESDPSRFVLHFTWMTAELTALIEGRLERERRSVSAAPP
jgi:class 3 adenylate cyclase